MRNGIAWGTKEAHALWLSHSSFDGFGASRCGGQTCSASKGRYRREALKDPSRNEEAFALDQELRTLERRGPQMWSKGRAGRRDRAPTKRAGTRPLALDHGRRSGRSRFASRNGGKRCRALRVTLESLKRRGTLSSRPSFRTSEGARNLFKRLELSKSTPRLLDASRTTRDAKARNRKTVPRSF